MNQRNRAVRFPMALALVATALFVSACTESGTVPVTEPELASAQGSALYSRSGIVDASEAPVEVFSVGPRFSHVPPGPGQAELVVNGGFELNDGTNTNVFAGWTVNDISPAGWSWKAQAGTASPPPGVFPVPAPPFGTYAAMTTQSGAGTHILSQVITLPPAGNGQLSFRLFIGNRAGAFYSPLSLSTGVGRNQQFRMDVMDPAAPITDVGAGVLLNVYQTQPGDPLISAGYMTITADLSAFNGQTVRLRFAEVDNQNFFNAGVDHVSVIATINQPPTVSLAPTPGELWPPNHKYVGIDLGLVYADDIDPIGSLIVTATAVSSDPDDANGNGDGNTTGDVKAGVAVSSNASPVVTFNPVTDMLELRAERGGGSGPRTYTITVTVTDSFGASATATATVTVPHNR